MRRQVVSPSDYLEYFVLHSFTSLSFAFSCSRRHHHVPACLPADTECSANGGCLLLFLFNDKLSTMTMITQTSGKMHREEDEDEG